MYATLKFDTEDVYYPPEYRIDDIPGWLAEIMTDVGVRGTFCTFGEKARSMLNRGRKDVLAAMAAHDLFSHTQGNGRPLIPEALEHAGWDDGLSLMRAYEDKVAEDFLAAFGRGPEGFSRHNIYWAPQHVAVAGERGLCYMSGLVGLENCDQPLWYAGTLNMPAASTPGFGGFDQLYTCDAAFEARLKELDAYLAACLSRGVEYVSVFGCHPVMVCARGWIEEYVQANGKTRSIEEIGWRYAVKGPADEARAKANFRRLCRYLKDHPGLEMLGGAEAAKLFSTQPEEISRDELTAYALDVIHADRPVLHSTFSPAELLTGLCASIVAAAEGRRVPDEVPRRDVLGPTDIPVLGREADLVSFEELADLSRQLVAAVEKTGRIAGNVHTAKAPVGAGQLLVLAARAYHALARSEKMATLRVSKTTRYPDKAMELSAIVQRNVGEHWPYRPDISAEALARQARLQAWTIKPAWLRPPRGKPIGEGRIDV